MPRLSPVLLFGIAAIGGLSALAAPAVAGSPLKCVEVRCRQPADARKSGSVVYADCVRKHGATACKALLFQHSAEVPLKGIHVK